MELRELITEEEYEALDDYRNEYAFQGFKHNEYMKPIKDILTYWNDNKQDLYHLLGDNLIISKQFNYVKSEKEVAEVITNMFQYPSFEHNPIVFKNAYIHWIDEYYTSKDIYWHLHSLIYSYELAKNAYTGPNFSIDLPNGKQYKVQYGTKVIKILGKIASAFNLPGFEDFRICHSLCLNDKKMSGKLCLSIHPLDYWTMSDNNYNWTSCMSWEDNGCYRQGTVEMMNSPMVIVAYLNGSEPYHPTYNFSWSNKKWRQLFIVNQDIIMGIKGYNYQNDDLTKQIINWIAELAEKNFGWQFRDYMCKYSKNQISTIDGDMVCDSIAFRTKQMYNDIDSLPEHYCRIGNEIQPVYNYSGETECVCCGVETYMSNETCLCCPDCDEVKYCDCCENPIYDGEEYYTIGDEILCEACHDEKTIYCMGCDQDAWIEDATYIGIIDYDEVIHKNIMLDSNIYLCTNCYNMLKKQVPLYENDDGAIWAFIYDIKNSNFDWLIPWSFRAKEQVENYKTRRRASTYSRYDTFELDELRIINPEIFPDEVDEEA